jgi:hypothetical protein
MSGFRMLNNAFQGESDNNIELQRIKSTFYDKKIIMEENEDKHFIIG